MYNFLIKDLKYEVSVLRINRDKNNVHNKMMEMIKK